MRVEDKIRSYIDANYSLLYINHFDFDEVDRILKNTFPDKKIKEYLYGFGEVNFYNKSRMQLISLDDYLEIIEADGYNNEYILVLKDVQNEMSNPAVISLLRRIISRNMTDDEYNMSVIIVSNLLKIPKELSEYVTVIDIPKPNDEEIKDIINEFLKIQELEIDESIVGEFVQSFKGLSKFQINQILNLAYQDGGNILLEDRNLIIKEKEQIIKKEGILELVEVKEEVDSIGGLENLISWIKNKKKVFDKLDKAIKYGVDIPKGLFILGMPGCGKSLTSKVTSKIFNIPLVRLDIGRLMGKYVGESEENLRKALSLTEGIAPCVLWVDEVEKAFSGVGGVGGASDITTRLFGQFLTWLQEKDSSVFIICTANDIQNIPIEFFRKGRFDELFFVDFPKKEEIKKIIEIHLNKRKKLRSDIDIDKIAEEINKSKHKYSGSDIEAIIKEVIEKNFVLSQKSISTEDILKQVKEVVPMSKTFKDKIEKLKEDKEKLNIKNASK